MSISGEIESTTKEIKDIEDNLFNLIQELNALEVRLIKLKLADEKERTRKW
jgi:regulator of replication initiation timing